jgi:hypothetical protein
VKLKYLPTLGIKPQFLGNPACNLLSVLTDIQGTIALLILSKTTKKNDTYVEAYIVKGKVFPLQAYLTYRVDRDITLSFLDLGSRRGGW